MLSFIVKARLHKNKNTNNKNNNNKKKKKEAKTEKRRLDSRSRRQLSTRAKDVIFHNVVVQNEMLNVTGKNLKTYKKNYTRCIWNACLLRFNKPTALSLSTKIKRKIRKKKVIVACKQV